MPQVNRQVATKKETKKKPASKRPQGILDRILSLDKLDLGGIKMIIYGHSGSGKTRLAGSFYKAGPLLHIVCSGNKTNEARSIRGYPNIDVVGLESPEEISLLADYIQEKKYVTVVLDHVTEFCNLVLSNILGLSKLPEQHSWGMAKQQDYQQMGLQVKEYLRELLDLSCNTLILGQQRTYDMQEENESILMPYISLAATPAVAGWLTPACDYVVHTYKKRGSVTEKKKIGAKVKTITKPNEKVTFFAQIGPSEVYITKFRVPPGTELPEEIEDPSYEKLKPFLEM